MSSEWATLAGVALGGLVGLGTTEFTRWRTHRNLLRTRWDEARLRAYFEYGAAVKAEVRTCDRIAASLQYRAGALPLSLEEGKVRLASDSDLRTTLLEQVRLVGSRQTKEAAQAWQQAAWDLNQTVQSTETGAKQRYLDLFAAAGQARDQFYAAAQNELGLTDK